MDAGTYGPAAEGSPVALSSVILAPGAGSHAFARTISGPNNFSASGSGQVCTLTPPDDGTYTATVTVTDGQPFGQTSTDSATIIVNNISPTLIISGAAIAMEGQPYALHPAGSDPGADSISTWMINWCYGHT